MEIEKKVEKLIKEVVINNNYNIEKIEYVKEENIYFLRIIISKQGDITVDDCVIVSNLINPILDENDIIEDNYILDVCSKGDDYNE